MGEWKKRVNGDPLAWLLGADEPGVRYLALRDLAGGPDTKACKAARKEAHTRGPIAALLEAMAEDGYWSKPGPGYHQKYRGTVWSILTLAQLGAGKDMDQRIARACAYVLDHALTSEGQFSQTGAPSGTIDCLQGNLCGALVDLGCEDPRLEKAFEWMARSVTGEGVAGVRETSSPLRYYSGKCGPGFACGYNGGKPCAWGAVKVMLALGKWPEARRTPLMDRAIQAGGRFLLGVDPASASYPTRMDGKPSREWWRFGFPVFYVTDLLQNVEALVRTGFVKAPRLTNALDLIAGKQDENGRWALEHDYEDKTWVTFGKKKQANPWVTLRALEVLKRADGGEK